MSTLSEQERHGLDDVFLSIHSTQPFIFKYKLSHYHTYFILHLKTRVKAFKIQTLLHEKIKITLKNTFLQKNSQKIEKTRKI
jgi:hypothetical protein